LIPYIESFLSQKESNDLFDFCRMLPHVRPPNPRNTNSRTRKLSYGCYSVLPTSRTGATVHGGGAGWLDKSPAQIKELAAKLSAYRGKEINYLSIVGYVDERDHIGWHNHREDGENEDQSVTVVSLGETRTLSLRPAFCRDKNFYEEFDTINGSVYVLPSSYNATHQHAILDDKRPRGLRISINCKSISPADLERLKQEEIEQLTVRTGQLDLFSDYCGEPRVWDCHAGKKYPAKAAYVGREVRSLYGNEIIRPNTPFGNHLRLKTQAEFRAYALEKMKDPAFAAKVAELKGKHLLCWCRPNEAANCHARVWLELANTNLNGG
jgi:hypothetical protein